MITKAVILRPVDTQETGTFGVCVFAGAQSQCDLHLRTVQATLTQANATTPLTGTIDNLSVSAIPTEYPFDVEAHIDGVQPSLQL